MTQLLKPGCLMAILCFFLLEAVSQNAPTKKAKDFILIADSLKSGNYKDVLLSFFQASVNNLMSENRELKFAACPYGVLLKANPRMNVDDQYRKYRFLRRTNVSFGLTLNDQYNFSGLTSQIKFALVDKRDQSTSNKLFDLIKNKPENKVVEESSALQNKVFEVANQLNNPSLRRQWLLQFNQMMENSELKFTGLDSAFASLIDSLLQSGDYPTLATMRNDAHFENFRTSRDSWFSILARTIEEDWLWTMDFTDTTMNNQRMFTRTALTTQLLKGFGKPRPGINAAFNTQAGLRYFANDAENFGQRNTYYYVQPGINLVWRSAADLQSYAELLLGGIYTYRSNAGPGLRQDYTQLFATLRFRIIREIWVPLQITYDPNHGNFLGVLSARFNFNGQGK